MKSYETIITEEDHGVLTVCLNRPDIHNAFNETMLNELTGIFSEAENSEVLCIILRGKGKSFCSGIDLQWMSSAAANNYELNYKESLLLSECFLKIYTCQKPTIAVAHGAVLGGANGLLSACDIAYCTDPAVFSLSEVKIGIIPSCISPYVIKRVGEYAARELMLTGRRINGPEAERLRLVNHSLPSETLEETIASTIADLRTSGPHAMKKAKNLIHEVCNHLTLEQAYDYTARMIADIRSSDEGQEGIKAFLEKRKPNWIQ